MTLFFAAKIKRFARIGLVRTVTESRTVTVGFYHWLVVLGLMSHLDSITIFTKPSPREGEKKQKKELIRENPSKQPPPAPSASKAGTSPSL